MEAQWKIYPWSEQDDLLCEKLSKELKISMASARLLVRRDIRTAEEARTYIRPSLSQLHDPFLMRDMDKAVERLTRAIDNKERILIYGDYDVDGTTAVSLVYSLLRPLCEHLDFYIPDRYTEGYGISFQGIDYAQQQGCTLIVALDCGIKAVDKVEYATHRNIDFIICDHHTPGETLPKANAVLNMKRADCSYPYKDLSGCGVGFKLMQALYTTLHRPQEALWESLPYLAMSIASDIVSMTGENRLLAFFGLKQMNVSAGAGIRALMHVAGIENRQVNMEDLVYKLGPRINASGRMKSGADAVRLLLSTDYDQALQVAEEINQRNNDRKDYDTTTTQEALEMLEKDPENSKKHVTVVYSPHWHKGVIGIAASRLTETYYRPTIVFTASHDGIISGSARSVGGFDIYQAIDSCRDLLTNFGGHAFAAGLSMAESDLPEFERRLEEYVASHIQPEQTYPTIHVEQEIQLSDITEQFFSVIKHLQPFGPGNPQPLFLTRHLINNRYTKRVGKQGEHLHLDLTDRTAMIAGIAFGEGDWAPHIQNGNEVDICYTLEENTFNHHTTIQMMAKDIKTCSTKETLKDPLAAEEA